MEQMEFFEREKPPKLPPSACGEIRKPCGYTHTAPREWTKEEEEFLLRLKADGWNADEIADSLGRSKTSISIHLKRIGKREYNYNADHLADKAKRGRAFFDAIAPKSVCDAYCGIAPFYDGRGCDVEKNDINPNAPCDSHVDALKFLCRLYLEDRSFDLVDLDPFGSAFDCFDLAVKMCRKGLAVTFGELGHRRWKRLDFVAPRYGISSLAEFTIARLAQFVLDVAARNKKRMEVFDCADWGNIGRAWFRVVGAVKITSQWEGGKNA